MKMLRPALLALMATAMGPSPVQAANLFMGAYPNSLLVFDESKAAVTQRIRLDSGLPTNLRLSDDKKTIYVTTITHGGVDVVDVATRKVVNSVPLNTDTTRYRFNSGVPDPTGKFFYTVATQIDKGLNRYEISKPKYVVIDLAQKKVVREANVDAEDETAAAGGRSLLMLSPDGKYLYQFRDKVIVIDTATLKVVERIDLARPDNDGLGDVGFGGTLDSIRTPGQYVSLFNATDPYARNRVFGVARFDLATRQFDFKPIGPSPDSMAGLQITPDGKDAYTVVTTGGILGNKRCEFWHFNMVSNSLVERSEFPCKTRFTFGMSSDGKMLYIYGASFEIEAYDARTLKYIKTWDLQNDITGAGMVITH